MPSHMESKSSTFDAMFSDVRPILSMMSEGDPLSPNLSLTPIMRITVGASSTSTSATADPSPPITEWSSAVTIAPQFAALMMAPRSIGLMVCMSMTAASTPLSASLSAASRALSTMTHRR